MTEPTPAPPYLVGLDGIAIAITDDELLLMCICIKETAAQYDAWGGRQELKHSRVGRDYAAKANACYDLLDKLRRAICDIPED